MSVERDELVQIIDAGYGEDDTDCPYEHAPSIAEKILAAGYRKPQQVTTVEEIDALPVGSALLDKFGSVWRVASEVTDGTEGRYEGTSGNVYFTTGVFAPLMGPFTVLHVGGAE